MPHTVAAPSVYSGSPSKSKKRSPWSGRGSAPSAFGATTSNGGTCGASPAAGAFCPVPAGALSCSRAWVCSIANVSGFMPFGTGPAIAELVDRRDARRAQAVALHGTHPGDEQQVARRDDLCVARGAAPAREHAELAPGIAPCDRGDVGAGIQSPIGDEGLQSRAAQREHRKEVVRGVHARGAVAQQQLDAVGARHAEPVELIDVCRELHERGHLGATRELAVLHDPAPGLVAREEVGEADELVGREGGLEDDIGAGGQRGVRGLHGGGQGCGIRRPRRGDLDDAVAEPLAVVGEHAELVLAAEASGALERGVFGFVDRVDAAETSIDCRGPTRTRTRPRP